MKKVMLACATVVLLVAMGACKGGADNKKAEEVEFTLAGTTWMGVFEEDWTEPLIAYHYHHCYDKTFDHIISVKAQPENCQKIVPDTT